MDQQFRSMLEVAIHNVQVIGSRLDELSEVGGWTPWGLGFEDWLPVDRTVTHAMLGEVVSNTQESVIPEAVSD